MCGVEGDSRQVWFCWKRGDILLVTWMVALADSDSLPPMILSTLAPFSRVSSGRIITKDVSKSKILLLSRLFKVIINLKFNFIKCVYYFNTKYLRIDLVHMNSKSINIKTTKHKLVGMKR